MTNDINYLLRNWEYDPDNNIRIITSDDGHEVMQVRLPLGIEQYELDGRPDGRKLFGKETVLDELNSRLDKYILDHGNDTGFIINHNDFLLLQNEGIFFYYRYLQLFQLGDFNRTARDTEHNLKICEFVEKYCKEESDSKSILQYKPYILRMNAISNAMLSLQKNVKIMAQQILEAAIMQIKKMPEIDTPAFQLEKVRSINYLKSALKQVMENKISPIEQLQVELEKAVEAEEYEKAAEIRDWIKQLSEGTQ
ncbi:MAG: UvrB/UvrC motif-containing protein [Spirochaetota bacterium]